MSPGILELCWVALGWSWVIWGGLGSQLGRSLVVLNALGEVLVRSCGVLGRFWVLLGNSWGSHGLENHGKMKKTNPHGTHRFWWCFLELAGSS